jgi:hypothetical protein
MTGQSAGPCSRPKSKPRILADSIKGIYKRRKIPNRTHVVFTRKKDGSYDIGIALINVRPIRESKGKYTVIDLDVKLPVDIIIDGVRLPPRMVLKIFRKLSERDMQRIRIGRTIRRLTLPKAEIT